LRILRVDDEKEFVLLVESALKREGYTVSIAFDGEEGVEKAKIEKPDLIICDINMPKKDGYGVLRDIRRGPDKNITFIMLSAIEDFKKIEEAYEYEADFYISKPVELAILLRSVRILLDVAKNRRMNEESQDEEKAR